MAMKLLQPSINLGLEEEKFWEMTIAEIDRFIKGATWRIRSKAQFDYILADLIGISVGRIISKEAQFPSIEKVYPHLYEEEELEEIEKQKKEEEAAVNTSKNRFLEFALKHNARMKAQEEV
jgi:hypothetical protein